MSLTGPWKGDDSASYYIHQIGNTVWWVGMSNDKGLSFTNVFKGTINNNSLNGDWVDIPLGKKSSYGTLILKLVTDESGNINILNLENKTGEFLAKSWKRSSK